MEALLCMMIDRRRKILKIATSAAASPFVRSSSAPSRRLIGSALGTSDLSEIHAAEKFKQALRTLAGFGWARLARDHVGKVEGDHIRYRNFSGTTLMPGRRVFRLYVGGKPLFSLRAMVFAESSAKLAASVSDNPDGCFRATFGAGLSHILAPRLGRGIAETSFLLQFLRSNPFQRHAKWPADLGELLFFRAPTDKPNWRAMMFSLTVELWNSSAIG
jgi:hypothetical protein